VAEGADHVGVVGDLLREDVLVADDPAAGVPLGVPDLGRRRHQADPELAAGRRVDLVGDDEVLRRREEPVVLQPLEPLGAVAKRALATRALGEHLRRAVRHLDREHRARVRLDDGRDLRVVGELVVVLRAGLAGGRDPAFRDRR
jgi:hypothetical protein